MNLADPGALKALLNRHGLLARKGLGQHFLVSPAVVRAIVEAASGAAGILEIGPGPGVLTSAMSERAQVLAIELDERMISALHESAPAARILKADALDADLSSLLRELPMPRAVVSNLPYYITGPLVTKIAGARSSWSCAVLMMQKEVGARILAGPGKRERGSLSVFLQALFEIEKVANVPAGAFIPPPKVKSIVLRLTPKQCSVPDEMFPFVRSCFAQPRKTLANNIIAFSRLPREQVLGAVRASGLDERARPQDLNEQQWLKLYTILGGPSHSPEIMP